MTRGDVASPVFYNSKQIRPICCNGTGVVCWNDSRLQVIVFASAERHLAMWDIVLALQREISEVDHVAVMAMTGVAVSSSPPM